MKFTTQSALEWLNARAAIIDELLEEFLAEDDISLGDLTEDEEDQEPPEWSDEGSLPPTQLM